METLEKPLQTVSKSPQFLLIILKANSKNLVSLNLMLILAYLSHVMSSALFMSIMPYLFYKEAASVDHLTKAMEDDVMLFREEAKVTSFLEVHIDLKDDGSIHLTQSGLDKTIVEVLHLNDSSISSIETSCTGFLSIDKHGEEAHCEFSYPSVVGQLKNLQGHSRCDIGMATFQVEQYVHQPKHSHELALVQIRRCLKITLNKGLILKPSDNTSSFETDVYVDVAFACGWGSEEGANLNSVKSCTGYITEITNCPVLWVSKLK